MYRDIFSDLRKSAGLDSQCWDSLEPFSQLQRFCAELPFFRLHAWLCQQRKLGRADPVPCFDPVQKDPCEWKALAILPTHLPRPPADVSAARVGGKRSMQKAEARELAWLWTELLISSFNYHSMQCPKSVAQYCTSLGSYEVKWGNYCLCTSYVP